MSKWPPLCYAVLQGSASVKQYKTVDENRSLRQLLGEILLSAWRVNHFWIGNHSSQNNSAFPG